MTYAFCTCVWMYDFAKPAKQVCIKIVFLDPTCVLLFCVPLGAPICVILTLFCEGGGVLRCNDS